MNKFRLRIYKKSMYNQTIYNQFDDFEMYDEILGHAAYKKINAVWHRLIANEYKRL